MVSLSFATCIIAFLVAGMALFAILWLYYDARDRRYYDQQRVRHVHFCVRCNQLYGSRCGHDATAPCPHCGHAATPLRF
jgi:hypothetical protein